MTEEQARNLSSVLTSLTGNLQMRAVQDASLEKSWKLWRDIGRKVSGSFGFKSYSAINKPVIDLIFLKQLQD